MADVESGQYEMMGGAPMNIKYAEREIRMGFVRKVYGILTSQLLLTVFIASLIVRMPRMVLISNLWMVNASLLVLAGLMGVMICCPNVIRMYPGNYLLLLGITVCEAVAVGFCSAAYDASAVMLAVMLTAFIFIAMTVYAWTTKSDFSGFGPYLSAALIALLTMGFGLMLMQIFGIHLPLMTKLYSALGILIFTMFIVVDTQKIIGVLGQHKQEFSIDDYCAAALMLYLDIINIFLDLLSLLGDNR